MTPKEKAKELVCKMYGCEINSDLEDIWILNEEGFCIARDCALIAANEVLSYMGADRGTEFWQQVKSEIKKL
jgi:hypothetical protein